MSANNKVVKIFTLEQQFPCGPKSSCCGPIGQSEEEVMALKNSIEKLGLEVEICDVKNLERLQENPQVFKLFRTFGAQAIPVITVGEEVACMGPSETNEVVSAIKSKL
jgi:hypothetical protein